MMTFYLLIICAFIIVTGIFVFYRSFAKPLPTLYENAKAALEKKERWTTWLTGLQTAAIAGMALLAKDTKMLSGSAALCGFFAFIFFGFSIVVSTWVLSGIPSVQQRLIPAKEPIKENDIYAVQLFNIIRPTLGRFSAVIHTYFVIGMILFALFILSLFDAKMQGELSADTALCNMSKWEYYNGTERSTSSLTKNQQDHPHVLTLLKSSTLPPADVHPAK